MTSEPTQDGQPSASPAATPQKPSPSPVAAPARRVRRTRAGEVWVAAAGFALILILLLIFILEKNQSVEISYFGAHGHMPLGVALLFAAVLGIILLAIPVTWRIIQLRRANRQQRHIAAKAG
jgi:lipopolysaccharide assembly protein A